MRPFIILLPILLFGGCIGTDLVDEPLGPTPARADIEETTLSLLPGEDYQLTFRILASDGSEISGDWIWSSRDEAVATVAGEGLVSATGTGQTWVDGFVNANLRDSVLVTVIADPDAVASIMIEGDTTVLSIGDRRQLTAVLRNGEGQEVTGPGVSWMSSAPAVADVDDSGLVEAISNGAANITASAEGVSSIPFVITVGAMGKRSGDFRGLNGYSAEGTVVLEEESNGARLVFEGNFRTQNGPGLHVYLSPEEEQVTGGVDLGELKTTSGTQSYDIPDNVNPDDYGFVLIHCQPFNIPFGTAALE